ncbi:hypothetical protein LCGC14_0862640 [marine sediment metagenome]|uniref:Uncharacterized protein n=1 Tax=marine sediment metagenome TaxID=412755 RepID=A0A0F9PSE3_9ZZZZ|nr:hypothetical protein [Candidatus Aminicenantes bacterium]
MDFRKTKVRVNSTEESIKVQNVLFATGWSWGTDIGDKTPQYTEKPHLYFNENKTMGYGDGEGYFRESSSRELTAKEIIGGRGKPIKEKPVDKHIVVEDSCNNSQGIYDSYDDAVDQAKSLSEKMVIYRMVRVATVQSERKVMRVRQVKIARKRKAGKRKARKK